MNTAMRLLSRLHGFQEGEPGAGGGAGGEPSAGKGEPGAGDKGQQASAPEIDYDKLAAAMVKAQGGKPPAEDDDKKSLYSQLKDDETKEDQEKRKMTEIRAQVEFDRSFDSFVKAAKTAFTLTPEKIRESAKNLEGAELVHALSCTAAKDFFNTDKNLELLPESDQKWIKENVIALPDKFIDSDKAWSLLKNAVHIAGIAARNKDFRQSGDAGDTSQTPNVSAYIKKCRDRGEGIKKTAAA